MHENFHIFICFWKLTDVYRTRFVINQHLTFFDAEKLLLLFTHNTVFISHIQHNSFYGIFSVPDKKFHSHFFRNERYRSHAKRHCDRKVFYYITSLDTMKSARVALCLFRMKNAYYANFAYYKANSAYVGWGTQHIPKSRYMWNLSYLVQIYQYTNVDFFNMISICRIC